MCAQHPDKYYGVIFLRLDARRGVFAFSLTRDCQSSWATSDWGSNPQRVNSPPAVSGTLDGTHENVRDSSEQTLATSSATIGKKKLVCLLPKHVMSPCLYHPQKLAWGVVRGFKLFAPQGQQALSTVSLTRTWRLCHDFTPAVGSVPQLFVTCAAKVLGPQLAHTIVPLEDKVTSSNLHKLKIIACVIRIPGCCW